MCINLSNLISVTWIILLTDLCYCRFSYEGKGNWELVKPTEGTKFRRSHACLHSQAGNLVPITVSIIWQLVASCLASLSILMHFQNYSEIALLLFVIHYWFLQKNNAGDRIKYYKLPKNTMKEQENRLTNYREN